MILQQSFLCLHYCTQRGGSSGSRMTHPLAYHRHWLFTSCPRLTTKFCHTKSWQTSIEKLGWVSSSYHITIHFFVCSISRHPDAVWISRCDGAQLFVLRVTLLIFGVEFPLFFIDITNHKKMKKPGLQKREENEWCWLRTQRTGLDPVWR